MKRKRLTEQLEFNAIHEPSHKKSHSKSSDPAGDPSGEATTDPAPIAHTEERKARSKYEPKEVYRAKKGDRFS